MFCPGVLVPFSTGQPNVGLSPPPSSSTNPVVSEPSFSPTPPFDRVCRFFSPVQRQGEVSHRPPLNQQHESPSLVNMHFGLPRFGNDTVPRFCRDRPPALRPPPQHFTFIYQFRHPPLLVLGIAAPARSPSSLLPSTDRDPSPFLLFFDGILEPPPNPMPFLQNRWAPPQKRAPLKAGVVQRTSSLFVSCFVKGGRGFGTSFPGGLPPPPLQF